MLRRDFLGAALAAATWPVLAQTPRIGHLLIVGGAEDRLQDRVILRKFIEYAGGPRARLRLITAASGVPQVVAESYRNAFADLGAQDFDVLPLSDRDSAFAPALREDILQADGIFMSGGDQSRLMAAIWETPVLGALHQAFHFRGACIGGTSAGAAVMSRHMISQGPALLRPRKDVIDTDIGLGLLPAAVVDQHFSERRRLARLLSALAQRPDLLGVGIDEDTALVVERGQAIEVIGRGVVTLVDPSQVRTDVDALEVDEQIEMLGLQLHTLPAGHRYAVQGRTPRHWPEGLLTALQRLVRPGPVRS
jgi:cyanophycinase